MCVSWTREAWLQTNWEGCKDQQIHLPLPERPSVQSRMLKFHEHFDLLHWMPTLQPSVGDFQGFTWSVTVSLLWLDRSCIPLRTTWILTLYCSNYTRDYTMLLTHISLKEIAAPYVGVVTVIVLAHIIVVVISFSLPDAAHTWPTGRHCNYLQWWWVDYFGLDINLEIDDHCSFALAMAFSS